LSENREGASFSKAKVKGNLVKLNIRTFLHELKNSLDHADDIILNLQELNSIDNHGVNAIARLHNEALSKKKKLAIIGFSASKPASNFENTKVA